MTKNTKTYRSIFVLGVLVFSLVFFGRFSTADAATKGTVRKPGKVRITSLSASSTKKIDYETYKITVKWKKPKKTTGVSYRVAYRIKTASTWTSWKTVKRKKGSLVYSFNVKTDKKAKDTAKAVQVKVKAVNSKKIKGKKRTKAGAYSAVKSKTWTVPSMIKKPGKPVQTMTVTSTDEAEDKVTATIDVDWKQPLDTQSPQYYVSYRTKDGEADYSAWVETAQTGLKKTLIIASDRNASDDKTVIVQTRVRTRNSKDGFTKMGDYSETATQNIEVASKESLPRDVEFSHDSGAYDGPISLEMTTSGPYTIHYTMDGSEPTADSPDYEGAIELTKNTGPAHNLFTSENVSNMYHSQTGTSYNTSVCKAKASIIRAAVFDSEGKPGNIYTKTYFIQQPSFIFPIISIVADPQDLLDYNSGIMVLGQVYDEWKQTQEGQEIIRNQEWWRLQGNYTQSGSDWERPINIEYLINNESQFNEKAGMRIKGHASRHEAQKSFNIYFKDKYGKKNLKYKLIPSAKDKDNTTISKYKSFSVRSGGNDTKYLKYRDPLLQDLIRQSDPDFETQESAPAIVFLNGDFYGFETMLEKYSDSYFSTKYGVDKDHVVVIKEGEVDEGPDDAIGLYADLMAFGDKDLSDDSNWNDFKELVDVDSMADYFAAGIIFGNYDWNDTGNVAIWCTTDLEDPNKVDRKWSWMMFDTETSTGLYGWDQTKPDFDSYEFAKEKHKLFGAALQNNEFKAKFKESFTKFSSQSFAPDVVESVATRYNSKYREIIQMTHGQFINKTSVNEYMSNYTSFTNYFRNRTEILLQKHPEIMDESMW